MARSTGGTLPENIGSYPENRLSALDQHRVADPEVSEQHTDRTAGPEVLARHTDRTANWVRPVSERHRSPSRRVLVHSNLVRVRARGRWKDGARRQAHRGTALPTEEWKEGKRGGEADVPSRRRRVQSVSPALAMLTLRVS